MNKCTIISGNYIGLTGTIYSSQYDTVSVLLDVDNELINTNLDELLFVFKTIEVKII